MRAQDVGWNANKLVLGKLSGRNASRRGSPSSASSSAARTPSTSHSQVQGARRQERRSVRRGPAAIVSDEDVTPAREHYKLAALKVTSETGTVPHARVVMGNRRFRSRRRGERRRTGRRGVQGDRAHGRFRIEASAVSVNAITTAAMRKAK